MSSLFGRKKNESTDEETRADRIMGRDGDDATRSADANRMDATQGAAARSSVADRARASADARAEGRDSLDADRTQPLDMGGDERTRPIETKSSGAGSSSATSERSPLAAGTAGAAGAGAAAKSRSSYGEDQNEDTRVEPIPTKPIAPKPTSGTGATTGAAAGGAAAGAAGAAAATSRRDSDTADRDLDSERAAERERRRAERDQTLGTRRKAVEEPEPVVVPKPKRTTDKFFGSLGLFLLRLVTATIMGLHGLWKIMNLPKVEQMLTNTVIPEPRTMAYVLAIAEIAVALGLLFGMFTRIAGLGLALIGIGALVFVKWVKNPFTGYQLGGELELLLGTVGLVFLMLGAGGWSVDAAFRRRRAANKKA
ncbi:DoxX family protein [Mariniluteicoccus flavus]